MTYDSRIDTHEHIGEVRWRLHGAIEDLLARAEHHDASKLRSPEKEVFDEFVPKLAEIEYGTDEYKASLEAMGPALTHHYERNRHHPEHFENGVRGMTLVDLIEMVCDWDAAAARKGGHVSDSLAHNQERFGYSDDLAAIIENTVTELLPSLSRSDTEGDE